MKGTVIRMRRWTARLLAGLLLVAMASSLGACGEQVWTGGDTNDEQPQEPEDPDDDDEENGGPDLPDFGEYTTAVTEARCGVRVDCCDEQQQEENFGRTFDDVDDCVEADAGRSGVPGLEGLLIEESVAEGRAEFDEAMAELCEESVSQLDCSEYDGTDRQTEKLPGCSEMITGLVEPGGECVADYECTTDECRQDPDGDDTICVDLPEVGEECPDLVCEDGAFCGQFSQECEELRAAGEPCSRHEQCQTDYCIEDQDDEFVCQDRPAVCGT